MSFYERLVKETEAQRQVLYNVSQLQDGLRGEIDVDSYIAYLTQAYHHVKHTVLTDGDGRTADRKQEMAARSDHRISGRRSRA